MAEIRLTRDSNPSNDDVIFIRKRHDRTDFLLKYTDGRCPTRVWVNAKTYQEIIDYLDLTLRFIPIDADPFTHLQATLPGAPAIMLNKNMLNDETINQLICMISDSLENPPSSFTV